ncbi:MAG: DUF192 domain-containing protein [Deltaproteobacteria bacterium]|nr:DUF192 domain-containing protein [Deltaproteobacteria bacterium]
MNGRLPRPTLLLLLLPPVIVAATCAGKKTEPEVKAEPTVYLQTAGGSEVRVGVEVSRTPEERRLGLMHRQGLDKGSGMVFVFEKPTIQTFWMKDTLVSLDMIFIGADLEVVGVVEKTKPMSLAPCMVDEPSQYVLEVEAGFAQRHGIGAGTSVRFSGFDYPGGG